MNWRPLTGAVAGEIAITREAKVHQEAEMQVQLQEEPEEEHQEGQRATEQLTIRLRIAANHTGPTASRHGIA